MNDLIEALQTLARDLGDSPTREQMNDHGSYSAQPYYREFGSWNDALLAAGFTPNHENEVADERLLEELRRLATDLERTPRFEDMVEYGAFDPSTYHRRFGSWPEAKAAAGLDPATTTSRRLPDEDLLKAIRDLAADLGRVPTQDDMNKHGPYSHRPYYREWESWAAALSAAGYEPNHRNSYDRADLLDEIRRLTDELGYPPTMRQMRDRGRYSRRPYVTTFGSWSNALEAAGVELREGYPAGRLSDEELIEIIIGLADELGHPPTRQELSEHGSVSPEPFVRAFGSWSNALEAAGFEPYHATGDMSGVEYYGPNWPAQRERALRRDAWSCQECGLTMNAHLSIWNGEGLHVHHREKFRIFDEHVEANQLENLITVCRRCHQRIE